MMRRGIVWLALAATLFACWWVSNEESADPVASPDRAEVVKKVSPLGSRQVKPSVALAQAMPVVAIDAAVEPASAIRPVQDPVVMPEPTVGINLFAALEMSAEASATEAAVAMNPYTYAGRLQEDGRWTIFLTDGQQQYVLHEGDYFAEGWQVAVLDAQKVVLRHAGERFEIRLDNGVMF